MRPVTWFAATLLVGCLVPLISFAQDAPTAQRPSPAEPVQVAPGGDDVHVAPAPAPPHIVLEPAPGQGADVARRQFELRRRYERRMANRAGQPPHPAGPEAAPRPPGAGPPHRQFQPPNPLRRFAYRRVAQTVKGSYLGVGTSSPPEALQRQLQLKPGLGLVVEQVEPGSPAEQAGVKQFDVLQKLNDQLLVNPEQLLVLVRTFKAGDQVKLTVIREGKAQELTATLVERDVPPVRLSFTQPNVLQVNTARETPEQLDLAEVLTMLPAPENPYVAAEGDVLFLKGGEGGDGERRVEAVSVMIEDNVHRMLINTKDGKKHLRVEDKSDGGVVFDGPIQTEDELGKVPTDVRDKIEKIGLQRLTLPAGGEPNQPPPTPTTVESQPTETPQPTPQSTPQLRP